MGDTASAMGDIKDLLSGSDGLTAELSALQVSSHTAAAEMDNLASKALPNFAKLLNWTNEQTIDILRKSNAVLDQILGKGGDSKRPGIWDKATSRWSEGWEAGETVGAVGGTIAGGIVGSAAGGVAGAGIGAVPGAVIGATMGEMVGEKLGGIIGGALNAVGYFFIVSSYLPHLVQVLVQTFRTAISRLFFSVIEVPSDRIKIVPNSIFPV
jgi:hypothetical protein